LNLSSSEAKVAAGSKEENNYEFCLVSTQDRPHWPVGMAKLTLVYLIMLIVDHFCEAHNH